MSASNFDQWAAEVDTTFRVELPRLSWDAVRALGLESMRVAMMTTPVDTGRARGNWQLTMDRPAEGELSGTFPGKDQVPAGVPLEGAVGAADAVLAAATVEDAPRDIWLHNGLDYISALNNGGPNRQAHQMLERARAAVLARVGGAP